MKRKRSRQSRSGSCEKEVVSYSYMETWSIYLRRRVTGNWWLRSALGLFTRVSRTTPPRPFQPWRASKFLLETD